MGKITKWLKKWVFIELGWVQYPVNPDATITKPTQTNNSKENKKED